MSMLNDYLVFLIKMVGAIIVVMPFILALVNLAFKRYYEAKTRYNREMVRVMSKAFSEGLKAAVSQKKQA